MNTPPIPINLTYDQAHARAVKLQRAAKQAAGVRSLDRLDAIQRECAALRADMVASYRELGDHGARLFDEVLTLQDAVGRAQTTIRQVNRIVRTIGNQEAKIAALQVAS